MNKYSNHSKSKQILAAKQILDAPHSGPVIAAMLMHEDIAKRAYEIYVETGRRQGQSRQNWLQAERELKNQQNWRQAGRDVKHQNPAGNLLAY